MQTADQQGNDFKVVDGVTIPPSSYDSPNQDTLKEEEGFFTTDFRSRYSEDANAMLDAIAWANASNEGIIDIPSSKYLPKFAERFGEQTINGALGLLALGEKIYGLGVGGAADVLVGLGMNESSANSLARDLMALPETLPPTVSNAVSSFRKLNQDTITEFAKDNNIKLRTELFSPELKNRIKNSAIKTGQVVENEAEEFLYNLGFAKEPEFSTVRIGGNTSKNKGAATGNINNIIDQPNHMIIYDSFEDKLTGTGIYSPGYQAYLKNQGKTYKGTVQAKEDAINDFEDFIADKLSGIIDPISKQPIQIKNLPVDFNKLNSDDRRETMIFLNDLYNRTGYFPTSNNIMATEIPDNLASFNAKRMIERGYTVQNTNLLQKFLEPVFGGPRVIGPEDVNKVSVPKNFQNLSNEKIIRELSTIKLSDVLDHNLLYEMYPEFKDLRIRLLTPRELNSDEYKRTMGFFQKADTFDPSSPEYDPNLDNEYSVIALNPNIFLSQNLKPKSVLIPGTTKSRSSTQALDKNQYNSAMDTILHEIQHAVQARSGIESIHTDFLLDYKQTMVAKTAGTLSKIQDLEIKNPNALKDATVLYKGHAATKDYDIVFYTKKEFDDEMAIIKSSYPSLTYSERVKKTEEYFLERALPNPNRVSPSEYKELKNSFVPIGVDTAKHLLAAQYYTFQSDLGRSKQGIASYLKSSLYPKSKNFKTKFISEYKVLPAGDQIDSFFNYLQKINEVEARLTGRSFRFTAKERGFPLTALNTPRNSRSISMSDIIMTNSRIDNMDKNMRALEAELFNSIPIDLAKNNITLSDDELMTFVENLIYQRYDPKFFAGDVDKTYGGTLLGAFNDMGFNETAKVIENIQDRSYDSIAKKRGLENIWRTNSKAKAEVEKAFEDTYYTKDGSMDYKEIIEIVPRVDQVQGSSSPFVGSTTEPYNPMNNKLKIR